MATSTLGLNAKLTPVVELRITQNFEAVPIGLAGLTGLTVAAQPIKFASAPGAVSCSGSSYTCQY
jgi:hypothetical protein